MGWVLLTMKIITGDGGRDGGMCVCLCVCVGGGGLLSISPLNDKAQTNPEEVQWAGSC